MKKGICVILCLMMLLPAFHVQGAENEALGRWKFYGNPAGVIYDISGRRQHMTRITGEEGYTLANGGGLAEEISGKRSLTTVVNCAYDAETDGVIMEIGNGGNAVFKLGIKNGRIQAAVKPSKYDRMQTAEAVLPKECAEITVSVNVASGVIRIYAADVCIAEKKCGGFVVNRFEEMPLETTEVFGKNVELRELFVTSGEFSPGKIKRPENLDGIQLPVSMWSFDAEEDGKIKDQIGTCHGAVHGCALEDEAVSGRSLRFFPEQSGEVNFGTGITERLKGKRGFTISFWIQELVKIQRPNIFNLYMEDGLPGVQIAVGNTQIQIRVRSKSGEPIHESIYTYHGYGVWDNLALSVNFEEGYVKVYHDGKELEATSGTGKPAFAEGSYQPGTPKHDDILGGERVNPETPEHLTGWIDEMVLYDRPVSVKEISALASVYGGEKSVKEIERVLYNSIRKKTQTNAVLYSEKGDILWNGEKCRLNPDDFSVTVKIDENRRVYVPESLFTDILKKLPGEKAYDEFDSVIQENGVRYVPAKEMAESMGLAFLEKDGLVIIGNNPECFTPEECDLMSRAFTAPNYPEPSAGHKYSRSEVRYSDYTKNGISLGSPCIIELEDGALLASYDYNGANYKKQTGHTYDVGICISEDGGKTWTPQGLVENMVWASIFEHNGAVYAIGREAVSGKVGIARSDDRGKNWSAASDSLICNAVISAHCAPTPVVVSNGRIYRAFEDSANEEGFAKWTYTKRAFVLSAPVDSDLMQASSWTMSNRVPFERSWMPEGLSYGSQMGFLEGNAVAAKDGTIYDIVRIEADPQSGYACALKLSPDGKTLSFDRIFEFPCGKDKFTIRYDTETEQYIALGNLKTTPGAPAQRNVIGLCASKDLFHWETREILFVDDSLIPWHESIRFHGIQYPDFVISGTDLLVLTRDAIKETTYYHNANYIDFWRIKDFRRFLEDNQ